MAFRSKAQIRKFAELHKAGKIGLLDIAGMSMGTDLSSLPERVNQHDERYTEQHGKKKESHKRAEGTGGGSEHKD